MLALGFRNLERMI